MTAALIFRLSLLRSICNVLHFASTIWLLANSAEPQTAGEAISVVRQGFRHLIGCVLFRGAWRVNKQNIASVSRQRPCGATSHAMAAAIWLVLAGSSVPSQSQTCTQVVQQIKQFDTDYEAAGGCPGEPIKPTSIPKLLPPGGVTSSDPTCTPDSKKMDGWFAAHKGDYDTLTTKLQACNLQACPPIKPVSPELCALSRTGKTDCMPNPDSDGDGIPESVETKIIARFSPFLRFSLSGNLPEVYRPIDPLTYIAHASLVDHSHQDRTLIPNSQLAADPTVILSSNLLGSPSNILASYGPTEDFSGCINSIPRPGYSLKANLGDGSVMGADWPIVNSQKNVGIFAHVSPFTPYVPADPTKGTPAQGLGDLASQ
jgi:hypothetical protein